MSQVVRECDRCVATTKSGALCRNRTCRGTKCWIHTKTQEGLRIRSSQVQNGGFGLYTPRRFPVGAKIADYTGEKMTRAQVGQKYNMQRGEYIVCRNDRAPLLAMQTMPEGTPFVNNARELFSRLSTDLGLRCIPAARCQFQAIRAELDRCHSISVAL
eukprot:COSAG02_NODE_23122_length_729_cov_1.588889_1_plen_158_part_00